MALMFTPTPSIKKAVTLINRLDEKKFPLLLSRILQKLHLKDERSFTEDEEEKLEATFELSALDLDLVITTLEFFLQQAAYHTAKPTILSQQLKGLSLEDNIVETIVSAWQNSAQGIIEKLRSRILSPKQLESIDWQLRLQMSQSAMAKQKMPTAVFQLNVSGDETNASKEHVQLEFTHDELYKFYNQLENIQKQIDELN